MYPLAMRTLALVGVLLGLSIVSPLAQGRGQQSTTIRDARVFDGRSSVIANGVVEIRGTKIVAVDQRTAFAGRESVC